MPLCNVTDNELHLFEVCQQKKDFTETLQHQHFSFTFALHPDPERVPTGQPKPRWQNDAGMQRQQKLEPPSHVCSFSLMQLVLHPANQMGLHGNSCVTKNNRHVSTK